MGWISPQSYESFGCGDVGSFLCTSILRSLNYTQKRHTNIGSLYDTKDIGFFVISKAIPSEQHSIIYVRMNGVLNIGNAFHFLITTCDTRHKTCTHLLVHQYNLANHSNSTASSSIGVYIKGLKRNRPIAGTQTKESPTIHV